MTEKNVSESPVVNQAAAVEANGAERVAELIEQLQQRTTALEEANRELRHVSHYRSLFLARMSHELRTPLTSILGFTEILLDQEKLTETQQRFCQKIRNSGMQLLTSLNQLVDLSRLEAGPAELFMHEFPLGEAVRDTCAAVKRQAQKNQVEIVYDLEPRVNTIVSDEGRFRQIFYTFLSWAVSRDKPGQAVKVFAQVLPGATLRLTIEDEGEPVKDLLRVFDPEEAPRGGQTDLNELGIIIGRRLLEVMKGTVVLENRSNGGLRTVIELPAGPKA